MENPRYICMFSVDKKRKTDRNFKTLHKKSHEFRITFRVMI